MTALISLYIEHFLIFVLVLSRISGLLLVAPILGSRSIPIQIRVILAGSISLLITPLQLASGIDVPNSLLQVLILLAQEMAIGLTIGTSVALLFMGLRLTGTMIAQMSALGIADVFDPAQSSNVSIFAQLMDVIAISIFLLMSGHRQVMEALLSTFQWMPAGQATMPAGTFGMLIDILHQSFVLGIRAGAPIATSLLLSILVMGLISRTLPQLNIFAIGFSINSTVLLVMLGMSLSASTWLFQEQITPLLETVTETLRAGS